MTNFAILESNFIKFKNINIKEFPLGWEIFKDESNNICFKNIFTDEVINNFPEKHSYNCFDCPNFKFNESELKESDGGYCFSGISNRCFLKNSSKIKFSEILWNNNDRYCTKNQILEKTGICPRCNMETIISSNSVPIKEINRFFHLSKLNEFWFTPFCNELKSMKYDNIFNSLSKICKDNPNDIRFSEIYYRYAVYLLSIKDYESFKFYIKKAIKILSIYIPNDNIIFKDIILILLIYFQSNLNQENFDIYLKFLDRLILIYENNKIINNFPENLIENIPDICFKNNLLKRGTYFLNKLKNIYLIKYPSNNELITNINLKIKRYS